MLNFHPLGTIDSRIEYIAAEKEKQIEHWLKSHRSFDKAKDLALTQTKLTDSQFQFLLSNQV